VKSLEWETWEQHCLWTLFSAHFFRVEDYVSIIPHLDAKRHAEALNALLLILRREPYVLMRSRFYDAKI
jgi:hypothetical protein